MGDGWVGDAITCPYCDHRHEDSAEFFNDGAPGNYRYVTCEHCGQGIHVETETMTIVSYRTGKQREEVKP